MFVVDNTLAAINPVYDRSAHARAERRSLAYHRAIAQRLPEDPRIVHEARARLATWKQTGAIHSTYLQGWQDFLNLPIDRLVERLGEDDETIRALRQVSPFAGVLSPRERWQLWRGEQSVADSA